MTIVNETYTSPYTYTYEVTGLKVRDEVVGNTTNTNAVVQTYWTLTATGLVSTRLTVFILVEMEFIFPTPCPIGVPSQSFPLFKIFKLSFSQSICSW